jgi:hypothetical protein
MRKVVLAVVIALSVSRPGGGQEIAVPLPIQFSLFRKILTFDRKVPAGGQLTVGILYQRGYRLSVTIRDEALSVLADTDARKTDGVVLRAVAVEIGDGAGLAEKLAPHGLDLLYVTPLRAVGIGTITALSRRAKLTTMTGVPEYVEEGIAIGVGTRGGKPLILVNLAAAKAEGCDLNSQLLNLARVIPGP